MMNTSLARYETPDLKTQSGWPTLDCSHSILKAISWNDKLPVLDFKEQITHCFS